MTRSRSPRDGAGPRDPRDSRGLSGILPSGAPLAAILSIVGLLIIGFVTMSLFGGEIPGLSAGPGDPGSTDDPTVQKTPTPSGLVVVPTKPPEVEVEPIPGTLLYVKDGNVWLQTDGTAVQLTTVGRDSMPTFSPDGKTVYFIRTREAEGRWPVNGVVRTYLMDVPALMSIPVEGGKATKVLDGLVDPPGSLRWMGFIRTPAVSPSGRYIAITTDMPDPTRSDVTLKIFDTRRERISDPGISQFPPLGHQDPVWRPDGERIAFVRNARDGGKGTPRIFTYEPDTKKVRAVTGPGYLHPSYSPDGKYLAATKTSAFGTDVVILNASNGSEILRLTDDGASWAPVWSPAGDQIAYLHVAGQIVDLRLIQLEGRAPAWTAKDPIDLTSNAGLDGISRPGWFVPEDQLPDPTPPPTAAPSSAPSAAPSASPAG
jgi:Tol biopolymer transport system component